MCAFARDFHATWPGLASGLGERRRSCLRSEPARGGSPPIPNVGATPASSRYKPSTGTVEARVEATSARLPARTAADRLPREWLNRVGSPFPAGPRGRRWRRLPTPEAITGDPSRSWQSRGLMEDAGQAMAWSVERSRPRCTSTKRLTDAQGAIRGVNTTVHSSV